MIAFLENKKVWGFHYPQINKVTKLLVHVFDRYEIHIKSFVDFINGKLIISRSTSPPTYFKNLYAKIHTQNPNTNQTTLYLGHIFVEHVRSS